MISKLNKYYNKSFYILILTQFITLLGNYIQRFALSLYILDLTGSGKIFSILLSLTAIPNIIIAPFGGAIADRFNKKNIMVFLDILSGFILVFFAISIKGNKGNIIIIALLMVILAIIQSIYAPTVRASVPIICSKDKLTGANSIINLIESITMLLGPILAGILYGTFSIELILIINIFSFFICAVLELFIIIPFTAEEISKNLLIVFMKDIKDTFIYLNKEKKYILYMIITASFINLLLVPLYSVGLPYVEKIIYLCSDMMYGFSEGFVGFGTILGALIVSKLVKRYPIKKIHIVFIYLSFTIALMGGASIIGYSGITKSRIIFYVIYSLANFIFAIILTYGYIVCITFIQKETPIKIMGKVMALVTSVGTALSPVGQVLYGFLFQNFKDNVYLIYILAFSLALGLSFFCNKLVTGRLFKNVL